MIKAGSRNECLETSGVSQYIKNLILKVNIKLKGTNNKTREQI